MSTEVVSKLIVGCKFERGDIVEQAVTWKKQEYPVFCADIERQENVYCAHPNYNVDLKKLQTKAVDDYLEYLANEKDIYVTKDWDGFEFIGCHIESSYDVSEVRGVWFRRLEDITEHFWKTIGKHPKLIATHDVS